VRTETNANDAGGEAARVVLDEVTRFGARERGKVTRTNASRQAEQK
jgi:hypothetical protein